MGKGRRKKNTKQPADSKPSQSINVLLPENVQVEELLHVIARAIVEAEKIKAQEEEDRRKAELEEWYRVIGCKDYDNKLLNVLNNIRVFFNILFLPKRYIKGNTASTVLLKSFISLFFEAMEWLSLVLAVVFIIFIPIMKTLNYSLLLPCAYFIPLSSISFMFSRIFRMANIENDKIDDRNYLFLLFTSITSFVSMVFTVIAAIIAVINGV